jgi:hypothetical protein
MLENSSGTFHVAGSIRKLILNHNGCDVHMFQYKQKDYKDILHVGLLWILWDRRLLQRMVSFRLQAVSCMDGKWKENFLCLISLHPQHKKPLVLTILSWWNAQALHFLRWIYAVSRKGHLMHGVLIGYVVKKEASEHWNYTVRRKSGIWNTIENLEYITKL